MGKKKYLSLSGILALLIGFALVIYGVYGTYKMAEARQDIESKTGMVPDNPIKGFVKEDLNRRVDEYRGPVAMLYVGGVVFILAGGILIYFGRKQSQR